MALFDRYIAVDWSANNKRASGANSIWVAEFSGGELKTTNPATRHDAVEHLQLRLVDALAARQRVFAGFDFPFGYPSGGARLVAGKETWDGLWEWLAQTVVDDQQNRSNRFEVGGLVNSRLNADHPIYWGHHKKHVFEGLSRYRPTNSYTLVPERRLAELRARTAQPVWKLFGNGSVGSQALLGIAALQRLRNVPPLRGSIAVWPFQTRFGENLVAPIIFAEIYPSLVKVQAVPNKPKDQVQVERMVELFSTLDTSGELPARLSRPHELDPSDEERVLSEEGWIFGLPA